MESTTFFSFVQIIPGVDDIYLFLIYYGQITAETRVLEQQKIIPCFTK